MKRTLLVMLALVLLLASCSNETESSETSTGETASEHPQVRITMEDDAVIELELYPEIAPLTVENFIKLVEEGFYDGLIFHRIIPDFMIQGGDPQGTGMGGPGYGIKGEFSSNGVENNLKHERGVLSMARSQDYDSAGSQFFIMHKDSPFLDGEYAAFGKVISGIEVVDNIVNAERDSMDKPLTDQVMKSVEMITP